MRTALVATSILFIASHLSLAQPTGERGTCAMLKGLAAGKATVGDPREDKYDVKYVKFDLQLTNQSTYIAGNVTTRASVLTDSLPEYVFELDAALVIDSVFINGALRPVLSMGDVRRVGLASPIPPNTNFTARVVYHGVPVGSPTILTGTRGFNNKVSPSWGTRVTFSQGESYHAKEWWPCKQSLMDKIDSTDMWVTVPDSMKAGSNGVLKAVTPIDATHVRYEWKERSPIAYYNISVAVAPYIDYSYYVRFTGSADSMKVQNYVYPNPLTMLFFKNTIDSTGMMINYFSDLYGRYPFWKEKYGHCMAPINGGQENQTMTTLGFFDALVVAHELGHQWFGDNVTCATWSDITVNEGFASYTEYLFLDHFHNHAQAIGNIMDKQAEVKTEDSGSVYVADTTHESNIFDGRLVYDKGACVLHTFRSVINDDSIFFHIYKTYQQEYRNGNASIADFKRSARSVLGASVNGIVLDTFFRQWMYGQGFPVYSAKWNQSGTKFYLQLDQSTSAPSSVSFFNIPVEILLHSSAGDTIIRINNDQPSQLIQLNWNKTISSIAIDPRHWLIYRLDTIIHDTKLSVNGYSREQAKIYPNPSTGDWHISALPAGSDLILTDITGKTLWRNDHVQGAETVVPSQDVAAGLYLLRVKTDVEETTYKLIKL